MMGPKKNLYQIITRIGVLNVLEDELKKLTPRWFDKDLADELTLTGTQMKQLAKRMHIKMTEAIQREMETLLCQGTEVEFLNLLAIGAKPYRSRRGGPNNLMNHLAAERGTPVVVKEIQSYQGVRLSIKTREYFKTRLNEMT
jgi:hypothetical protein